MDVARALGSAETPEEKQTPYSPPRAVDHQRRVSHLVLRGETQAWTRNAPQRRNVTDFGGGEVALNFAMKNAEVARGVLPQISRQVDQVAETGLAPAQFTDDGSAQRLLRPEPRDDTRNIANLMQLVHRGPSQVPLERCDRVAVTAHTNAANSSLQKCGGATTDMLP